MANALSLFEEGGRTPTEATHWVVSRNRGDFIFEAILNVPQRMKGDLRFDIDR